VKLGISIEKAHGIGAYRRFVYLPRKLYRGDPLWTPPLWIEELGTYRARTNPLLADSDFALFLACEGKSDVGRVVAYVDHAWDRHFGPGTGFFGAFESGNDPRVSVELLRATEQWLEGRGVRKIIGPINPVSQYWGCLYEGFDSPASYMTAYNPPYYNAFFMRSGYAKAKDLVAYEADVAKGYVIPERFREFSRKLLEHRPGLTVRRIDMSMLEREAEAIWRITNASLEGNWGYYPVGREIMVDMLKRLKLIVDPDAIWFVEENGEAVGYALAHRDINVALAKTGGRILPLGFIKLLREIPRINRYRLLAFGVVPRCHSWGLDVLLYVSLHDALAPRGDILLDANWILEDNAGMRNAIEKLGLLQTKTYRIYEKTIGES
jgi:hypothetical protein